MAFKKKTWKDRLVEFAGRRTLKRVSGSADSTLVVDVSRNEGTVSQAGDTFSAANMNDLEQRIADGFSSVSSTILNATLDSGKTTLTFTSAAITDDSLIDVYTDPFCSGLTAAEQDGNTLTLTFGAQKTDMRVHVKVG